MNLLQNFQNRLFVYEKILRNFGTKDKEDDEEEERS